MGIYKLGRKGPPVFSVTKYKEVKNGTDEAK